MSILDVENIERWIMLVFASLSLIVYQVQARGWATSRVWFLLLNTVIIVWTVFSLISSTSVPSARNVAFFGFTDLVTITELAMVSWVARKELRRYRAGRHAVSKEQP